MHIIQINDATYKLPENWDELTPKQLLYLVKLTQSDISVEQVKTHMMLYCLNAHVCRHKKSFKEYVRIKFGKNKYFLLPEEVCSIADQLSFLLHTNGDEYKASQKLYHLNPELTVNPYPTVRCQLRKFFGPDDQLLDITFEQFMYMQTYLDAMQSDPSKIDYLLACLWHRRKVFDINRIDHDAAILHHLPETKKVVMYWFILGSLTAMSYSFPRIFSGTGTGKVSGNGQVFDSQLRLLDSLAQSDMTKKPEVRKGFLLDALYSMDESIRRKEETEERLKS